MRSLLISALLTLGVDSRYSTVKYARLAAVTEPKSAEGIGRNYTQDANPPNKSDGHMHMDPERIGDPSALLILRREAPEEEKKNESADDRLWENYTTDSNPPNKSDGHKHMDRDRIGDPSFLSKVLHREEPKDEEKEKKPEASTVGDNDANFTQDSNPPNKSDGHTHMDRNRIGDPSLLLRSVRREEPADEKKEQKPEDSTVGDTDANFTQDSNPPNKSDGHTHMDRDRIGDPSLLLRSVRREEPADVKKEQKPEGSAVGDNDANFTQDSNPPNKSDGHTHMDRDRIGDPSLLLRSVRREEPADEKKEQKPEGSTVGDNDANFTQDSNPPNKSDGHTHMDRNRIGDPSLLSKDHVHTLRTA